MHDEALALLALTLVPGLGPQRVRTLRASFGSARAAADAAAAAGVDAWRVALPGWAPRSAPDRAGAERERERVARVGATLQTDLDPGFPSHWAAFDDLPPLLYVRGRWPDAFASWPPAAVAVVGSRRADAAALAFAEGLGRILASSGVVVVSGMAYGIDAAAHRGALSAGADAAPTVAVLAGGVDRPGPSGNVALARAILAAGGALVSEAPIGSTPARGSFPRRNRLVAALARSVAVVSAAEASGAHLTAGHAARYGRDVFVVPARPWDEAYAGNLALLRDGATALCSLEEAPAVLAGVESTPAQRSGAAVPPRLAWAWSLLGSAPAPLDSLIERSGRTVGETLVALELLVAEGLASVDAERRYGRR
jgi:DNA processing protein